MTGNDSLAYGNFPLNCIFKFAYLFAYSAWFFTYFIAYLLQCFSDISNCIYCILHKFKLFCILFKFALFLHILHMMHIFQAYFFAYYSAYFLHIILYIIHMQHIGVLGWPCLARIQPTCANIKQSYILYAKYAEYVKYDLISGDLRTPPAQKHVTFHSFRRTPLFWNAFV